MPYYSNYYNRYPTRYSTYKKKSATNSGISNRSSTGTQYRSSRSVNSRIPMKGQYQRPMVSRGPQIKSSGSIASSILQLERQRNPYWASTKSSQDSTEGSNPTPQEPQLPSSTHPKTLFQSALTSPMPKIQPTPLQAQASQMQLQPHMPSSGFSTTQAPRGQQ